MFLSTHLFSISLASASDFGIEALWKAHNPMSSHLFKLSYYFWNLLKAEHDCNRLQPIQIVFPQHSLNVIWSLDELVEVSCRRGILLVKSDLLWTAPRPLIPQPASCKLLYAVANTIFCLTLSASPLSQLVHVMFTASVGHDTSWIRMWGRSVRARLAAGSIGGYTFL